MTITTDRLLLREFVEEDRHALLCYQNDPRYLRFYDGDHRTEEDAREMVGWFLGYQRESPRGRFQLAITLRSDGTLIGNCGVRTVDPVAGEAEMGCELDPEQWGRGYAREAIAAMLRFGFGELGLRTIRTSSIPENVAAARLVERFGFRRTEVRPGDVEMKGRWWDTIIHELTDREWLASSSGSGREETSL